MKILDNLKSLGYIMEIRAGNIRLSYKGEGKPDKEKVLPLLEELKGKKNEAIKILQKELQPVSIEVLDDMLFTTIRRTKKDYSKAVMDYARDNHEDISQRCTDTSVEISRIYALCREGTASLNDFKAVLEPYHNACTRAIELYKKAYPTNTIDENTCARCGRPGERYCFGLANPKARPDKQYAWGMFCFQCEPY